MSHYIGIFRKIPINNTVTRVNGLKNRNKAVITNIAVNEEYKTYKKAGYEVIQIGNKTETVNGRKEYIIKYTYNLGKDPLKNVDELYYNLIGNEWDATIENVEFRITMPKTFDEKKLEFSSGNKGSTDSSNVEYTVNGNVISGYIKAPLKQNQAVTVRLELPEGYFTGTKSNTETYCIFIIFFSIGCVLISYIIWHKYGKDNTVAKTIEHYPPEGYNSAEVAYLYNGKVTTEGITSLLIYLANKGYIKIEEIEAELFWGKEKSFKITKIKEYDGNNENERIFLEGLFKEREVVDHKKAREIMEEAKNNGEKIKLTDALEMATYKTNKTTVTKSELTNDFYLTINSIRRNLNKKENRNKIFEPYASVKQIFFIVMAFAIAILNIVKIVTEYETTDVPGAIFVSLFIGLILILVSLINGNNNSLSWTIFGVVCVEVPWIVDIVQIIGMITYIELIMQIIGMICVATIFIFMKLMPKRTQFGTEMKSKIGGFKKYLETVEKQQVEEIIKDNPEYYYNILPYTYALGVSDIWAERFKTIAVDLPSWYMSNGDRFDVTRFMDFMHSTISSINETTTSGGGSGSGSSGGGSGGGGGGSW